MSDRPRVFIARRIPDEGLDPIAAACEVDVWEDELPPSREALLTRVAGCHGILTLLTDRVDDVLLDAAGSGFPLSFKGTLTVSGTKSAHGKLTLKKDVVTGTLGGARVSSSL